MSSLRYADPAVIVHGEEQYALALLSLPLTRKDRTATCVNVDALDTLEGTRT
jgi:hypothetical protein